MAAVEKTAPAVPSATGTACQHRGQKPSIISPTPKGKTYESKSNRSRSSRNTTTLRLGGSSGTRRGKSQTLTGEVSDSMCGAKHDMAGKAAIAPVAASNTEPAIRLLWAIRFIPCRPPIKPRSIRSTNWPARKPRSRRRRRRHHQRQISEGGIVGSAGSFVIKSRSCQNCRSRRIVAPASRRLSGGRPCPPLAQPQPA